MHADVIGPKQEAAFARDGFVLLREFVAGHALADLLQQVDRFIRETVPVIPPEQVFYEDKQDPQTLKQVQHVGEHDPWFADLFLRGRFREAAAQLLSGEVIPKNFQYFNKAPGCSKPTPPHQDGFYFMLQPCQAVTMWLALDAADTENGCVRYVPGSHLTGMRAHTRTGTLGFSQGIADYPNEHDQSLEIAICAQPGDLLVHHAMTIHRADANRSDHRSRRSLGLIYYSQDAREDAARHAEYQKHLVADLKAAGKL